ncbi:unnamed protein product [Malassezia sympodialis ATCC 42132]|nr:uncharacterized protein MSY001_2478 [Malassezia sympodialis ATCC 42132]CCU99772.1 unnamed protein product [Malassezia sympodialis ATCC 42132]|eukprot:XP_018741004.1 uncharacterized protein MSY001_2478 [Malassezia sympodialis ATCC 42132]
MRLSKLTEKDNSSKMFMKELRKVLEHADVLLEVLDVRDPLGCRAYTIEQEALRLGKKVVLILNKIDLVSASNTRAWLEYLRKEFPTLPFKASTQQQRHHLGQNHGAMWKTEKGDEQVVGGAEAVGTRAILQLIKNYSRNLNLKSSITVGTIGAPNVGKSSLINSLKRSRVCGVASTPGHTKVVQGIMLDRHVRLLDSPGIVFSDANAPPGATSEEIAAAAQAAMLRNVLKVELVEDPQEPVQAILDRMDPKYLAEVYDIPELPSRDVQDFLLRLAYQKGRIARGALPDLDGTARSVLHDWNTGKIKYQTEPPAKHPSLVKPTKPVEAAPAGDGSAAILSSFSEEFDLAGLLGEADAEVLGGDGRYSPPQPDPVPVPGTLDIGADVDDVTDSTLGKRERDDSDSDEDMTSYRTRRPSAWGVLDVEGDDEDEDDLPEAPPPPKKAAPKPMFNEAESEGMAPSRGKERRKARKEKKRRQGLAQTMDTLMDLDAGMAAVEPAPASDEEEEL